MAVVASLPLFIIVIIAALTPLITGHSSIDESPLVPDSCYCLRRVIDQINNAVSVVFYMEGTRQRQLVVEQRGVVSRYEMDGTRVDTFMDIRDRVVVSDEFGESRGLLSLVLDPSFHVKRIVYAYYIRNDDGKEYAYVSKFNAFGGSVDPSTEQFLLRIYQPYIHGNGGPMLFGDDGFLYIFTGDGGGDDDPYGRAQDLNYFSGKALRIDVQKQSFSSGESGIAKMYAVPASNPMVNKSNAQDEIFASGIRNMWGCSQDSVSRVGGTGRIFCAETGTTKHDEINIIESGRNYGWSLLEGTECRNSSGCPPIENEGRPIYDFTHTSAHALVGGYVYRGQDFSKLAGSAYYVYGDVLTGNIYFLEEQNSGEWTSHQWDICNANKCPHNARETKLKYIMAFSQDKEGELYLSMTDNLVPGSDTAKILKLVPPKSSTNNMASDSIASVFAALMTLLWAGYYS